MDDGLDATPLDDAPDQGLIADIAFDELGLFGHRPGKAGGEIVENDGPLAGIQQLERHMAADISRPAGHKNAHLLSPFWRKCRRLRCRSWGRSYQRCRIGSVNRFRERSSLRQSTAETSMPTQKKRIRKAVFPVAGLGTRFLPATKAVPKEMLTVVDRPVIQHVVDEAKAAGIEHFIFVTGRNKGAIEDHFDSQFELERTLAERGKTAELDQLMAELPRAGPDQLHPPAEPRSGSATRCGARARSSATSRSRCCCPTCCTTRPSPAWQT